MDLLKYTIPEKDIATEGLSDTLKGASIIGIALLGLGLSISDWKKARDQKAKQDEEAKKEKSKLTAKAAWFDSPEGKACKQRLQRKYGQDINVDSGKLKKSIQNDIIRIAKKINSNKKTCQKWMTEYIEYAKSELGEDPKFSYQDAKDLAAEPCAVNPEDYSFKNDWSWAICDLEQTSRTWLCDKYLFSMYENALNTKYADEISWGILTSFKWVGDGDEGLIGVTYQPIFDHIRGA